MAASAVLAIKIIADDRASGKLKAAGDSTSKWGDRSKKAAGVAAGVLGGMVAFGKAAFDSASNLQQQAGAVESVFGKNAGTVNAFAKNAAQTVGLATSDYSELAGVLGSQLGNMGISQGKLAGTTDQLINKGADLSAQFGGSAKDAVGALSSALKGEMDPLEKYGVGLSQAKIQSELAARGQSKLTGKAATAAKTAAILSLITEQTASSTGAFARESDTASGAQARSAAAMENAKASLGTSLLPVVATAATKFGELAGWVQKNSAAIQKIAPFVAAFAAVILIVVGAMRVYTAVQAVLNAVQAANPVMLIVLGIILLVGILIVAYKKSSTFRAILQKIGAVGKKVFTAIVNGVKRFGTKVAEIAGKVKGFFTRLGRSMKDKITAAVTAIRNRVNALRDRFSAFRTKVAAIFTAIKTAITTRISGAVQSVRDKVQTLRDKFSEAKTFIADKLDALRTKIRDALEYPFNKVADAVQWVRDKLGGISWPTLPGWLQKLFDMGSSFIGRVFSGAMPAPAAGGGALARGGPRGGGGFGSSVFGGGGGGGSAAGGLAPSYTFHITLSGVTDPAGAARAVTRAIDYSDTLRGKPVSIRRPSYAR